MKRNAVGPTQSLSFPLVQPIGQQPSPPVHVVIAGCVHITLHMFGEPVSTSCVQALLSDAHVVGQFPSQASPVSTTPFPHMPVQLLSLLALQPIGQHESPPVHVVIGVKVQRR
jgi:hypothetical protein